MVEVNAGIVVAYKFLKIHLVVRVVEIYMAFVGRVYVQQWKRQLASHITGAKINIGKAKWCEVKPFVYSKVKRAVIILATRKTFDAQAIAKVYNGVMVGYVKTGRLVFYKLLMRRPTQVNRH